MRARARRSTPDLSTRATSPSRRSDQSVVPRPSCPHLLCPPGHWSRTLSSQQSNRIEIESFEDDNDFSEILTHTKFEELNMDLFRKTMRMPRSTKKNIDEVNTFDAPGIQAV